MCFRIALVVSLVGAVAGERSLIADMDAVLVNAPTRPSDCLSITSTSTSTPFANCLMAEKHPPEMFAYETYDFHTTPQANQLMHQLNAQEEWNAFLNQLNAALKKSDQVAQNERGLRLAAQFNLDAHSKLQGWKVTFYTRFTRRENGKGLGGSGDHYLVIEPESSNLFYEKHVMGPPSDRWGEWDRGCCCKESTETECKFSWSGGKCCKFKYGDIKKNKCSSGWMSSSKSTVSDDAYCRNGPDVPSFPGWKSAEYID